MFRQAVVVLALVGLALPARGDDTTVCTDVSGPFRSTVLTGEDCPNSPVGLCTLGFLGGPLAAQYAFDFLSLSPTADPNIFTYTGVSTISLRTGQVLMSEDTGTLIMDPVSGLQFTTNVGIISGSERLADASGSLVASGAVAQDNKSRGTYSGTLCLDCGDPSVNRNLNRFCH
jgi:hypothetical protein